MYYLIYTSTAAPETGEVELYEILEESVRNNQNLDITGLLIYHHGSFIQVLEGPRENVHTVYAKIKEDVRHSNVVKLCSGDTDFRCFPKWHMALEVTHERTFKEIQAFKPLRDVTTYLHNLDQENVGLRLIKHFYQVYECQE